RDARRAPAGVRRDLRYTLRTAPGYVLTGGPMSRFRVVAAIAVLCVVAAALVASPAISQTPKSGGVLTVMQREDLPQGFAIHETSTISTVWPSMPCFNNLVMFDPLKKTE